jgi:TIR domain-containing protein
MTAEACTGEGCYFLSYSRADEKIALRLASDLRDRGVAMWLDQLDIRPSEHWDRAIERAVRECRGLVVILSPRSVASDNVADEISFAIDSGKSVLPVMIERCTLPLRLTRMQVVDATDNYERALQQCVDELTRRDGEPVVRKAPEPAPVALDAGELSAAKQRLAQILGPIAGRLVDKAAARAASIPELYRLLAANIPNAAEREGFLALGGAASVQGSTPSPPPAARQSAGAGIAKADLDSMAELMARYIGPIARVVVTREGRASESVDQLRQQLAVHIPDLRERAEFLREAERR